MAEIHWWNCQSSSCANDVTVEGLICKMVSRWPIDICAFPWRNLHCVLVQCAEVGHRRETWGRDGGDDQMRAEQLMIVVRVYASVEFLFQNRTPPCCSVLCAWPLSVNHILNTAQGKMAADAKWGIPTKVRPRRPWMRCWWCDALLCRCHCQPDF